MKKITAIQSMMAVSRVGATSRAIVTLAFAAAMFLSCGTSAWAGLMSGSLSTPILYDSSAYGIQPAANRPQVANTPGGLVATAAWYDYGMKMSWDVTQNSDSTYTYHYLFGPGWYPATNPKADPTTTPPTEPYVTNKNITAFDIQLGSSITSLSQLSNLTWNAYQFNGPNGSLVGRVGTGDATGYWKCNPMSGAISSTSKINKSLLSIGEQTGEIGYTNQDTLDEYYVTSSLFHGLQWLNPTSGGNFVFSSDINFELTFTSTEAPGLGSFFANSTRTGGNNNQSDVVAYNSTLTGYSYNMLTGDITLSDAVTVAGGAAAPVPIPPAVILMGSGLLSMGLFKRRKISA